MTGKRTAFGGRLNLSPAQVEAVERQEQERAARRRSADLAAVENAVRHHPPAPAGKWDRVNAARSRGTASLSGPERAWFAELERRRAAGEVVRWSEHPCSVRLGHGLRYEPDALSIDAAGALTLWEVKGPRGWELDSEGRTKFLAAVEAWPWARFGLVVHRAKKDGGGFEITFHEPRLGWPPAGART